MHYVSVQINKICDEFFAAVKNNAIKNFAVKINVMNIFDDEK
jgi:hypothetical protein